MLSKKTPEASATPVLGRYQGYGLLGGITLGFSVGVLVSGPQFYKWPVTDSLAVICGCAVGGAFIGWVALSIAAGSVAGSGAWGASDASIGSEGDSGGGDGD